MFYGRFFLQDFWRTVCRPLKRIKTANEATFFINFDEKMSMKMFVLNTVT